jgi:hypothetical protein
MDGRRLESVDEGEQPEYSYPVITWLTPTLTRLFLLGLSPCAGGTRAV